MGAVEIKADALSPPTPLSARRVQRGTMALPAHAELALENVAGTCFPCLKMTPRRMHMELDARHYEPDVYWLTLELLALDDARRTREAIRTLRRIEYERWQAMRRYIGKALEPVYRAFVTLESQYDRGEPHEEAAEAFSATLFDLLCTIRDAYADYVRTFDGLVTMLDSTAGASLDDTVHGRMSLEALLDCLQNISPPRVGNRRLGDDDRALSDALPAPPPRKRGAEAPLSPLAIYAATLLMRMAYDVEYAQDREQHADAHVWTGKSLCLAEMSDLQAAVETARLSSLVGVITKHLPKAAPHIQLIASLNLARTAVLGDPSLVVSTLLWASAYASIGNLFARIEELSDLSAAMVASTEIYLATRVDQWKACVLQAVVKRPDFSAVDVLVRYGDVFARCNLKYDNENNPRHVQEFMLYAPTLRMFETLLQHCEALCGRAVVLPVDTAYIIECIGRFDRDPRVPLIGNALWSALLTMATRKLWQLPGTPAARREEIDALFAAIETCATQVYETRLDEIHTRAWAPLIETGVPGIFAWPAEAMLE